MEKDESKKEIEGPADNKSYAGIPEAEFVVIKCLLDSKTPKYLRPRVS